MAGFAVCSNSWIFNQEFTHLGIIVDVYDQFALSKATALIYQSVHDSFWYEVNDIFLHDREVTENEVLNDSRLHDEPRALLIFVRAKSSWNIVEEYLGEIAIFIYLVLLWRLESIKVERILGLLYFLLTFLLNF